MRYILVVFLLLFIKQTHSIDCMQSFKNFFTQIYKTLFLTGINNELLRSLDVERIKDLIKKGAMIDHKDFTDNTILHYVSLSGSIKTLTYILSNYRLKLDVNSCNNEGETPLHFAVKSYSCPEDVLVCIELLIKHGARINVKNKRKETPLDVAKNNRNNEIYELLYKYMFKLSILHKDYDLMISYL